MQCRLWSLSLCVASMLALAGCTAHNLETRLISSFIENLEKSDIEELKGVSSTDFKGSALRHDKAIEAFKMLNLPDGKVTVVDVKEMGPDEKRVLVKVGERERKLYFDLTLDPKTKKWVVQDVEFKKILKPGQVNKSVTEQMDLLLSIQEILDAWETGDRNQILANSSIDLRKSLEPLPEKSLKQLSAKIMSDLNRERIKPEVEGHAKMALINLKRKGGETLLTVRFEEDKWVADDIAVQSRKEDGSIPSLRKQSHVLLTAIRFCESYQSGNKSELAKFTEPQFFRRILQTADLSKVPLPIQNAQEEDFDIKLLSTRAEVLVKRADQIVQLTLTQGPPQRDDEGNAIESSADSGKPFLVEEITFHEVSSNQDKRISAMLSSQSLVVIFAEALAQGDLKSLRFESTADFQARVWSRIELDDLAELPLEQIEPVAPQILDTMFKGPLTEVTVNQGSTPLTYVLRDQNGRLLVDDVLTPALDRPNSLKMNLEVQIPLRNFARGLRTGDMRLVRDNASREFNKLVFQSMNRLPKLRSDPAPFLVSPVNQIQMTTDRANLVLGDERYGAKVFMYKEGDHYVVDDILMVSGLEQSQRTGLKKSLRELVLSGTRFGNAAAKADMSPSSLDRNEETTPVNLRSDPQTDSDSDGKYRRRSTSRIQQASHTSYEDDDSPNSRVRNASDRRGPPLRSMRQDDLDLDLDTDRDQVLDRDVRFPADSEVDDETDQLQAELEESNRDFGRSRNSVPGRKPRAEIRSRNSTTVPDFRSSTDNDSEEMDSDLESQYSSPAGYQDDIDVILPPSQ